MRNPEQRLRILYFIARLTSGGKERRLIELLSYLKAKDQLDLMVVVTKDQVHYSDFYKLDIPYLVVKKQWLKNDFTVFYKFYKVCRQFRPDIIHTWGRMQTLYTLPAVVGQKIPLVNGQITAAPPRLKRYSIGHLIDKVNFTFSKKILSNSMAGVAVYQPPQEKTRVIYNGINLSRFANLPPVEEVKEKYRIKTRFTVVMAATFSPYKDYDLFFRVAKLVTACRDDITFIGVGGYDKSNSGYLRMVDLCRNHPQILFPGRTQEVEALVNACNIGVLFSNRAIHGEGISNSILEYMSLSKPVIANDAGGTKEVVRHLENGYLITHQTEEEIAALIIGLIDNPKKAAAFGAASKRIIEERFSLEKMGKSFEEVYEEVLGISIGSQSCIAENNGSYLASTK